MKTKDWEKIATKYLAGKQKQEIQWNKKTGSVKILVLKSETGEVVKETLMEVEK